MRRMHARRNDKGFFTHTAKATNRMNVLKCYPRGGIRMWGVYERLF